MRRAALGFVLLAGCSWSAFDDLGGEMWVDSVGPAEGVAPHDFLGVAAPGTTGDGNARFLALGRSTDSVGSYSYDPDGARASEGVEIRAGTLQFGPLGPEAVIAGDPYSNFVGVLAVTGAVNDGDTKLANFPADDVTTGVVQNDFDNSGPLDGPISATGLAYARTDDDGVGTTTTDAALARGPQIALVSDYSSTTGHTLAGCYGATSNDLVLSIAAGQFEADADDELVAVINNDGANAPQMIVFNGRAITSAWAADMTALQGCFLDGDPDRAPLARIPGPGGDEEWGFRTVVGDFDGDGDDDIAVSSAPLGEKVTAYINDGSLSFTEVVVPPPVEAGQFGVSLAAGDLDGDGAEELIVGAAQANTGADNSGSVIVYTFDGSDFAQAFEPLHDAQPENEQRFGKSLTVMPWDDTRNVLIVGGEQELYVYFQTHLYDDVRQ